MSGHNTKRHMFLMVLCCLIPVVAIAIVWYFGFSSSWLYFGIMLLCPAMHFLMMGSHGKHEKAGQAGEDAKLPREGGASGKGGCH